MKECQYPNGEEKEACYEWAAGNCFSCPYYYDPAEEQ